MVVRALSARGLVKSRSTVHQDTYSELWIANSGCLYPFQPFRSPLYGETSVNHSLAFGDQAVCETSNRVDDGSHFELEDKQNKPK